ncbi:MAG: MATE family efflux transporter [Armatimonadetes bacterium]|nr:MATE family efflux transporter [Armatimonadota bacterium]
MTAEEQQHRSKHGRDLTVGSIPRHLVAFSLPMLAGSTLQTAYSVINAIWVGKGLGKTELAAVTVSFPVFFFLMAVAGGLTMAANILTAQSYGAKDFDQLRRVVRNSVVLTIGISIVCVVFGHFAAESILVLMNTPANVLMMAARYLQVFLLSIPFMFGLFLMASLLRGTGDSTTPLYFQAAGVVLTTVLDPLLMFGWLGFPKMGLNGTAVATIITNAGAMLAVVIYLQRKRHLVAPDWRHLGLDWWMSKLTLKIGIPSMVQQGLVSVGMLVMVGLINAYGENGAAAFGAAMRIDQIAFMPAMTLGMAVSTLAGQNIGAERFNRVKETFKWGLIIGCGITALASLLVVALPRLLLRAFLSDPAVIGLGVSYLRIVGGAYVLFAVMFVSNGVINGAGHTLVTTFITLLGLWGVRVPLAYYLSNTTHRIEGVWWGMVAGFSVGAVLSLTYYLSGRWKKPIVRKSPAAEPEIVPIAE